MLQSIIHAPFLIAECVSVNYSLSISSNSSITIQNGLHIKNMNIKSLDPSVH